MLKFLIVCFGCERLNQGMKLKELLGYDSITIQCHDNPDADAIASGYGLYLYFLEQGKDVTLMYAGNFQIQKHNLKLMVEQLNIPIVYEEDKNKNISGLLITVDCQYGAKNVTKFQAEDVVIIDHHQQEITDVEKTYIRSNLGSCSTLVWNMLVEEGFPVKNYSGLQTALYYGLYTDTGQFAELSNPFDRDLRDGVNYDKGLIHRLQNSNMSVEELEIAGVAMIRSVINKEQRFAVVKAQSCDPNILGLISDLILQVSEIDLCVVFNVLDFGIKFSVRSCVKEAKACHVAQVITKGIGSGGGHLTKAGGFISKEKYKENVGNIEEVTYFVNALSDYTKGYEVIQAKNAQIDVSDFQSYVKKNLHLGYVEAKELFPCDTPVLVRTLEGDLHIKVTEDTLIMIGIRGEVYPITREKFQKSYVVAEENYHCQVVYQPIIKNEDTGEVCSLLAYAKSCISVGRVKIRAKQLDRGVKVFSAWDEENYMVGEAGDYLAVREDDSHDIYVIEKDIFGETYEKNQEGK